MIKLPLLLLSILTLFDIKPSDSVETIICDTSSPCNGATVSCTIKDERCDIVCNGTNTCVGAELRVPESTVTGRKFNIDCYGTASCTDIKIVAYRGGNIFCREANACNNHHVTITDRLGDATTKSLMKCVNRGCKSGTFNCDDPNECYYQIFDTGGAGGGANHYVFRCKTGYCRLGGKIDTWINIGSGTLYCEEGVQGGCEAASMPDPWVIASTNFPSNAPTAAPTDPTPGPTDQPTPAPTENPTPAPTDNPTPAPTTPTFMPTFEPTGAPTDCTDPACVVFNGESAVGQCEEADFLAAYGKSLTDAVVCLFLSSL